MPAHFEHVYRLDLSSGETTSRRRTQQGGLIADANLTRTGVFEYRDGSGKVTRELRSPEEVFAHDSLKTYPLAPVTIDHPGRVGPDNWKTHSVGHIGPDIRPAGEYVRGEVHVQHGDAMDRAEKGELTEVSCGYHCDLDPTPGVYQGKEYDGVQRNIRVNHVALGPKGWGRMGPDVRLHMDSNAAISGATENALTYVRDNREANTMTPEEKGAFEKAQNDAKAAAEELAKARADAASAKTAADKSAADLATIRAEMDVVKAAAERNRSDSNSSEKKRAEEVEQQRRVEELISLRADARAVFSTADDPEGKAWKADGKAADQIRREVLSHLMPAGGLERLDSSLKAANATEVIAVASVASVYDTTMADWRRQQKARADALEAAAGQRRDASKDGEGDDDDDDEEPNAAQARKDMLKRKRDAWKTPRKDRGRSKAA